MNIADFVLASVRRKPDTIALIDEAGAVTYQELWHRIEAVSSGLLALGFQKGDKIAVLMGNRKEYVEIYLDLMRIGVVIVPINHWMVPREVEVLVRHADIDGFIVEGTYLDRIADIVANIGLPPERVVVVDGNAREMSPYERLLQTAPLAAVASVGETDRYGIYYTSGTTGTPKGALRDHRSMTNCALTFAITFGLAETDRYLVSGPLFHFSHSMIAQLMLMLGGSCFVVRDFVPERVLGLIERHRISVSFMVPTMWNDLLAVKSADSFDVSSLRVAISSGAPLLTATKEGILRYFKGVQLFESYGWSELNFLTVLRPEDQLRKERCVGKPMIGSHLKLVDEKKREIREPDAVGTIYGRCPGEFSGYFNNPDANASSKDDEWWTGNDMGRLDDEGYLYIVDRRADMIISGGENIFPGEIEEIISTHPKVDSVAVIGVPDDRWGEAVKALVVPKANQTCEEKEILEYCRERLASFKRPKSVDFLDELPKNSMGKILKRELRERFWAGRRIKV